jgi:hypothetical protein
VRVSLVPRSSSGAKECLSDVAKPVTEFDRRVIHGHRWKHKMESSFELAVESGMHLKHESPEVVSLLHKAIRGPCGSLTLPSDECYPEIRSKNRLPMRGYLRPHDTSAPSTAPWKNNLVRILLGHSTDVHLRSKCRGFLRTRYRDLR